MDSVGIGWVVWVQCSSKWGCRCRHSSKWGGSCGWRRSSEWKSCGNGGALVDRRVAVNEDPVGNGAHTAFVLCSLCSE